MFSWLFSNRKSNPKNISEDEENDWELVGSSYASNAASNYASGLLSLQSNPDSNKQTFALVKRQHQPVKKKRIDRNDDQNSNDEKDYAENDHQNVDYTDALRKRAELDMSHVYGRKKPYMSRKARRDLKKKAGNNPAE
ncbi:hypothetical protein HK100_008116 [Physocladia obscura]|uniref:Uncharacterized protein n=1 Tax=Physocladia obscura TaxID=109957 RepID=A0AAD5TA75_9FUNG|nr:hypothetical protein HK100_008116 [Physocladia obscura]